MYPGELVTKIDGVDHAGRFEAFLHAPFKYDCARERNDTSLSMQITLTEDGRDGKILLFGDLAYETIKKIFDYSEPKRPERVEWDLLLAPHHCSKKVMYPVENGAETFRSDIMDALERNARDGATIVATGEIPVTDKPSANPPHRKAADRYREIVDSFIATMEWPSKDAPSPVVFGVDADGPRIVEDDVIEMSAKSVNLSKSAAGLRRRLDEVAAAATAAGRFAAGHVTVSETGSMSGPERIRAAIGADRGADQAPKTAVGFGRD